jgi:P27 family predicted phage terminase small subunit
VRKKTSQKRTLGSKTPGNIGVFTVDARKRLQNLTKSVQILTKSGQIPTKSAHFRTQNWPATAVHRPSSEEPSPMPAPRPPAHLQPAGRAFYRKIAEEWEQGPHEETLLVAACDQLDIIDSCKASIAEDGLTITTVKGALRENPAVATMRQATRLLQSLVRQMDLTEDTPSYQGRVRPHRHRKA